MSSLNVFDELLERLTTLREAEYSFTIKRRQSAYISSNVGSLGVLLYELENIAVAVSSKVKKQKYYQLPKEWPVTTQSVLLDDFLTDASGCFQDYAYFLRGLEIALQRILLTFDMEYNEDFREYYLDKPNRLYQDLISVLDQLIALK